MDARYEELTLDTQGDGDILDVTALRAEGIDNAGLRDGLCTVFVAHSTCGMTTIEHEPGCNADLNAVLEACRAPGPAVEAQRAQRRHQRPQPRARRADRPVGDDPVPGGELLVGTWQKVVCIDFDDRPAHAARSSSSSSAS